MRFLIRAVLTLMALSSMTLQTIMLMHHPESVDYIVPAGAASIEHPGSVEYIVPAAAAIKPCIGSTSNSSRKTPFRNKPTLVNYTQDQGFDPIATPYVMNWETACQYMSYYGIAGRPVVYVITPTYRRDTQLVDLVTLSQTLQHDKGVYWIVIEDAEEGSKRVRDILERSGMMFAHGNIKSLDRTKHPNAPRGVLQRNMGLDIVDSIGMPGVVYFGDDDNGYDIRLMEGIRYTKGVGIFGVGFRSQTLYARCMVDPKTGKVAGTSSKWYKPGHNIAVDMAGFCANAELIKQTKARFRSNAPPGRIENDFLKQLGKDITEMEPLLDNCTKIYAWHIQSKIDVVNLPKNTADWDPQFKSIQPGV